MGAVGETLSIQGICKLSHVAYLAQNLRVPKNDNAILGASESDVQSSRVVQETDPLVLVAPNTAKDDVVLFSALECVHAGNFDLLIQVLLERAIKLHVVDDVRTLSFVWCDDTDLRRNNTRLEEFRNNLLHVRGFRPVNNV